MYILAALLSVGKFARKLSHSCPPQLILKQTSQLYIKLATVSSSASAENFPGEGGATEKRTKIRKKYRKMALFSLFQAETNRKKTEK